MLQQSNGTTSKHSLNGHVLINEKEHGSKSGVPWAAARGAGIHAHHCMSPWELRALKRAER
jgi:hypothetical protein